jgi:hypothetical protein
MKELYRLTMTRGDETRVEHYGTHRHAVAALSRIRNLDAASIRRVDPVEEREYRIAYVMADGGWDIVDRFSAVDDAGANAYAATYFDGDEWYVLDDTGRNISGGRDQA